MHYSELTKCCPDIAASSSSILSSKNKRDNFEEKYNINLRGNATPKKSEKFVFIFLQPKPIFNFLIKNTQKIRCYLLSCGFAFYIDDKPIEP